MKTNIFFVLILLFLFALPVSAQSFKAMYEGEEVNLHDGEVMRDLFILQISQTGLSSFQSYYALQRDSIRSASIAEGLSAQESIARMRSIPPGSKSRLYYNPAENKYTEIDYGLYYFRSTENIKMVDFVFVDSTKLISGYHSEWQKHTFMEEIGLFSFLQKSVAIWSMENQWPAGIITEAYTVDGAYRFHLVGFKASEKDVDVTIPSMMLNQHIREVSREELAWIRKQTACMDLRPIIKKYSKNYDMSGMYHDKIDQTYRELSKRYQYIEQ